MWFVLWIKFDNFVYYSERQGYINRGTCSQPELTSGHVLSSAYVIIFWAVATNAVNKSVWRKKTVLDFPSTNMQWIMNNLWDTEHGSLRTRAQCSGSQSTVLCVSEIIHYSLHVCSREVKNSLFPSDTLIYGICRDGSKIITYALGSTWHEVSSGCEHVPRLM